MPAIRVLFDPEAHRVKTGLAVLGGTLAFVSLGKGASLAKLDAPLPAVLRFHGAYLASATDLVGERKAFAEIAGEIRRRTDGGVVFTLPKPLEITYVDPPADDPPPTQLNLHYDPRCFENIPGAGSSALSLKLPSRPEDARHFEVVTQLEIQGAVEGAVETDAILDVPLAPLTFFKARLVDKDDAPLAAQPFELELTDGSLVSGETDADGVCLVNPVIRGESVLHFKV
jgi:hypothetical protein